MLKTILGIDVGKKFLDVVLIFDQKRLQRKFDNSPKGFNLLAGWLASLRISEVHACLEATGIYGEAVAEFLYEKGHRVSVVNPAIGSLSSIRSASRDTPNPIYSGIRPMRRTPVLLPVFAW